MSNKEENRQRIKKGNKTLHGEVNQSTEQSGDDFQKRVAQKAYELFEQRGRLPGHDVEDWLEAERLLRADSGGQTN